MSESTASNNSHFSTTTRPLSARELLRDLITRNLEIIETRTACLMARSFVAYNTAKNQTFESMFDAFTDIIAAPFLRLGKRYRESPITREITEASRAFNNTLITAKREAALRIRLIIEKNHDDPPFNRKIQRLGLRFPLIKLDIEELIAADEADADADAAAETGAKAGAKAKTEAEAKTQTPAPAQPTQPVSTHPADLIIAAEIAKQSASPIAAPTASAIAPTAPATAPAPTPPAHGTPTPPRGNPLGSPYNPNKKRNRFKKRRAA